MSTKLKKLYAASYSRTRLKLLQGLAKESANQKGKPASYLGKFIKFQVIGTFVVLMSQPFIATAQNFEQNSSFEQEELELVEHFFPNDDIEQYDLAIVANGPNQQVVDPEYAVNTYGKDHPQWVQRVRSHPNYQQFQHGQVTCSTAIKVLFKMVCDEKAECAIEQEYRNQCVKQLPKKFAQRCEQVVRSYVQRCFGDDLKLPNPVTVIADGNEPVCSASFVQSDHLYDQGYVGRNRESIFTTIKHCPIKNHFVWCLNGSRPVSRIDETPPRSNPLIKFGQLQDNHCGIEQMSIGEPQEGEQTFFMGYNDLLAARKKVIKMNGLNAKPMSPFRIDSSPLCTIVKVSNHSFFHTCQSTKGGSGGALYQINGEKYILVGINEGAPNRGQVYHNLGQTVLK